MSKMYFLLFCFVLVTGCEDPEVVRQQSLKAAQDWIQENKLDATASCRYPNPNFCDVVPKDPRPNMFLYCDTKCRISMR